MRRIVVILLALGLWQIAFAQIHCALEASDCEEGRCELCHFNDLTPNVPSATRLPLPVTASECRFEPERRLPLRQPLQRRQGRAPPQ